MANVIVSGKLLTGSLKDALVTGCVAAYRMFNRPFLTTFLVSGTAGEFRIAVLTHMRINH
jgi:hypothetical protein